MHANVMEANPAATPPALSDDAIVPARRRYRLIAVPSGALLFLCMFLPFVQVCDRTVTVAEAPLAWLPHLVGLACAIAALVNAPVRRAAWRAARARAVMTIVVAGGAAAWFFLWTLTDDALVGAPLALWASCWLMVAAAIRARDLAAAVTVRLPPAGLGRRSRPGPMSTTKLVIAMTITFLVAAVARPVAGPHHTDYDIDLSGLYRC